MTKSLKIRILLSLAISLPFIVTSSFNACSNVGFEGFESSAAGDSFEGSLNDLSAEGKNTLPVSLMSAEQVLRSMSSVSGVTINNNIQQEYNRRQTLLASGFDIKMINSPMWIGVTNVASTICNELIAKEAALSVDQREFFNGIDFTKPITNVSSTSFEDAVTRMSQRFWGRELEIEESNAILDARQEFESAIDRAMATSPTQTRNLILFTCTGMLASFDSISL